MKCCGYCEVRFMADVLAVQYEEHTRRGRPDPFLWPDILSGWNGSWDNTVKTLEAAERKPPDA